MKIAKRLSFLIAALFAVILLALTVTHKDQSIQTDIWIDAPAPEVWQVLTATSDYPSWNPMISKFDGQLREGSVVEFTEGTGEDAVVFHPTILTVREDQELRWKGYVWKPGIFDGEHDFRLEANGSRTHLIQAEKFTGLLAGRFTRSIVNATVDQMNSMNLALKHRVEAIRSFSR